LANIPVRPVKGEMIALQSPDGVVPGPVVWGAGVYLVPRGDRLLVGATVQEIGFDTTLTAAARDHLRGHAERLMPALKDWRLVDHWAGLRPGSADGLPLLGPLGRPDVLVASGQFRNGILFAPAIARHVSAMAQGHEPPIPAFDPLRFTRSIP
jgi:glycine oxidase